MTDFTRQNLRDRIAAAITEVDRLRVCKLSDADTKFITDAVIAALQTPQPCRNCGCPLVRDWEPAECLTTCVTASQR